MNQNGLHSERCYKVGISSLGKEKWYTIKSSLWALEFKFNKLDVSEIFSLYKNKSCIAQVKCGLAN
ncbi:MAG: hypothetical protein IPG87_17665 [Saprospiraceae bacterium]|nr:hypothetical protein [Candidatus Vicinibacter affinis]